MRTARELLKEGTELFTKKGLSNPARDSEFLLYSALKKDKLSFYTGISDLVGTKEEKLFLSYIKRRAAFEPVSYILGNKEFMDSNFFVNKDVLIPRPETEHLVENAIELANKFPAPRILDIGTGSGCIAICVRKAVPSSSMTAVDISEPALKVAKKNAKQNGIAGINFLKSDLFSALKKEEQFEMILSNPPYVTTSEYAELLPETRKYEPKKALVGGSDGLDYYKHIAYESAWRLVSGGFLLFEVGHRQAGAVQELIDGTNLLTTTRVVRDHAYIERVVIATKKQ